MVLVFGGVPVACDVTGLLLFVLNIREMCGFTILMSQHATCESC